MFEVTGWAWEQDLPPAQKLALLYLSNRPDGVLAFDPIALARFVGIPVYEVSPVLAGLRDRGLIFTNGFAQAKVTGA